VWDLRLQPYVRDAAELDVISHEPSVAHGAVQRHEVDSRDIVGLDLNPHTTGEIVERLPALVARPGRECAFIQLYLLRPIQSLKRRRQVAEATTAAQVIYPEYDCGVSKPAGSVAGCVPLYPEQHRNGARVFDVVDSEKRRHPYDGHRNNLPKIAEREFHPFASQSRSVGMGNQLQ
jgi:hypothetical protein